MIARKCDRCGVLYERYIEGTTPKIPGIGHHSAMEIDIGNFQYNHDADTFYAHSITIFDLCPDCMKQLIDFIAQGRNKIPHDDYRPTRYPA